MTQDNDGIGSIEDLHAQASEETGLDDFGGDEHLEGLRVLLDSFANEATSPRKGEWSPGR